MSRYLLGGPVRLFATVTVTDPVSGITAATDAGGITLTVAKPDASQQTYLTPTHDATGKYHQDVPAVDLTQIGHYTYAWTTTGAGAGVSRGDFDLADPFEPALLPLADAKVACNIPQTTTTYDAELQQMIDTVTTAVETITGGPAYTRSITERVRVTRNYTKLVLRKRPVVSVTAVVDRASGASLPLTDIDVDTNSGIVGRRLELPWFSWGPFYDVTYLAGWGTSIPAAFNEAARMIVVHLWNTQRGPGIRPYPADDINLTSGMTYAIPYRALEVLRPFTLEVSV